MNTAPVVAHTQIGNIMNAKELAREALALIDGAKARDGILTAAERARLKAIDDILEGGPSKNADPHGLRAEQARAEAVLKSMFDGTYKSTNAAKSGKGHLSLKLDADGAKAALTTSSGGVGLKALLAEGVSVAPVSIDADPVAEGRPAASLLDLLPVIRQESPVYAYLRQTQRTENAKPVARGELKPTSVYGLTRVDGRLRVVAHLSEPVSKFDLSDYPSLETFLKVEMLGGLNAALVTQALNGDGVGENFTGLNATSGILTQAFSGDTFTTLRKSLTALEVAGHVPSGIAMHPTNWEAFKLARENGATGAFIMSAAPVDVARRLLFGVPVAATAAVPVGTAWVLSEGSAHIRIDAEAPGAVLEWGMVGDDFARNQIRARAELRADLSVERPGGIVKVSLTA